MHIPTNNNKKEENQDGMWATRDGVESNNHECFQVANGGGNFWKIALRPRRVSMRVCGGGEAVAPVPCVFARVRRGATVSPTV
jgi:hypothetical protein